MNYSNLEKLIEYQFKNTSLLEEALSHPSMRGLSDFEGQDYERMEFLGDAVINLIITKILYFQFPDYDEGDLAKVRAYFISKDFMVQKGAELGLGEYIIMASGEESSGGRDNPNNLENVLESIIGAIFLDGGIETAAKIVEKLWGRLDPQMSCEVNPKSFLQEFLQDKEMGLPIYEVVEKTGQMHSPTYKVSVKAAEKLLEYGIGSNIKKAEKDAAKNMIKKLRELYA